MDSVLPDDAAPRLERSCGPARCDWLRRAPAEPVLERFEAYFTGHAYDPHRHDRYAIGYTLSGVQLFRYRGADADSRTGHTIVIHPDEVHDGHAGPDSSFRYRMLYVEPRHIQAALGEGARALPFVPQAVTRDARLMAALLPALGDLSRALEPLEIEQTLVGLADALMTLDPSIAPRPSLAAAAGAVERARAYLDAHWRRVVPAEDLEVASGLDRYTLARQFRARLGTSPFRYLTMRRLDQARAGIRAGQPLAEAAFASGFADQSHMTRHFKRAFGLTPGRWLALQRAG